MRRDGLEVTRRTVALCVLAASVTVIVSCSESPTSSGRVEWRVAEVPELSIGELDGDVSYLFQSVEDADFLPDGGVVVADGGRSVIRTFDSTGSFVSEFGRAGEGPEEFQHLRNVWTLGDSVVAWDPGSRRLTWLAVPLSPSRAVTLERSDEASGVGSLDAAVGALTDGTVAIASLGLGSSGEVAADLLSIETFGADGAYLGRVLTGTGLTRFRVEGGGSAPIPFSPLPRFTTHGSTIYYADGSTPTVTALSAGSADTIALARVEHDVDAAWTRLAERVQSQGPEFFADMLPSAPRPDSLPQVAGLLVDAVGRIWTKGYAPSSDGLWARAGVEYGGEWNVVDAQGTPVATVRMPRGFRPLRVADDLVLGVLADSLGVERVQVRRVGRQE